jgi:hypothetical protein
MSSLPRETLTWGHSMTGRALAPGEIHYSLLNHSERRASLRPRRYDELAHALDEQLGLQPTRETRIVYRQLLGQG